VGGWERWGGGRGRPERLSTKVTANCHLFYLLIFSALSESLGVLSEIKITHTYTHAHTHANPYAYLYMCKHAYTHTTRICYAHIHRLKRHSSNDTVHKMYISLYVYLCIFVYLYTVHLYTDYIPHTQTHKEYNA